MAPWYIKKVFILLLECIISWNIFKLTCQMACLNSFLYPLLKITDNFGGHEITLDGHTGIMPLLNGISEAFQFQPLVQLLWFSDWWKKLWTTQCVIPPLTCSSLLVTRKTSYWHRNQELSRSQHLYIYSDIKLHCPKRIHVNFHIHISYSND